MYFLNAVYAGPPIGPAGRPNGTSNPISHGAITKFKWPLAPRPGGGRRAIFNFVGDEVTSL